MNNKFFSFFALMLAALLWACGNNPTLSTQELRDENILQQYFTENKLNPTKHSTGFYYTLETNGAKKPVNGDSILFHYEGATLYGQVFDNTRYYPKPDSIGFRLGLTGNTLPSTNVTYSSYAGFLVNTTSFQDAVRLLGEKEKGIFYFPSRLLFGSRNLQPLLPANSVVKLKIDVLKIKPQ